MNKTWKALVALVLLGLAGCDSELTVTERLELEAALISAWDNDPAIITAVTAQNAQNLSLAEIQTRDAAWVAVTAPALITATTTGACANRLRALIATKPYYGETLVMDNKGALVCASEPTSDYWQGDEDKWLSAFNGGAGSVFIDEAHFDASAQAELVQISVPIKSGNTTVVGVITVGILIDKL
jgi:hypothetical protein